MANKSKPTVLFIPSLIAGSVLAAIAGFALLGLQAKDIRRYEHVLDLLREAKQTETAMAQNVLKIRFGFSSNYDVLPAGLNRQKEVVRQLKGTGIDSAIDAYVKALEEESALIERFMTDNATFSNSLRYFPTLALRLTSEIKKDPSLESLNPNLSLILRDTLIYCYTDSETELEHVIEAHQKWLSNVPGEVSDSFKKDASVLGQHLKIILQYKNETDRLVRDLLSSSTLNAIGSLEKASEARHAREVRQGAVFKVALIFLCAGLIVLVLASFFRLRRAAAALREANDNLERRVQERTHELEQSQAKLLQAQKMESLGQLAASVAHDLNNQLTPVRGYLDMILMQMDPKDPNQPLLDEVNQAALRSIDIVQRLVNFSKPSTKKKVVMRAEPLIEEIRKMLPQMVPASIECHVTVEKGLWSICGNETELQTVVVNLIGNARDAMPNGGSLTLRVENAHVGGLTVSHGLLTAPYVAISVVDSGTGMAPEVIQRIFEPFFSTKGRAKGTGLGLSMAFNIIKAHDGWLDVSTEVGKGSAFQVYLPAIVDASASPTDTSAAPTMAKPDDLKEKARDLPKGKGLILFVDDEERIRAMGKIFLESLGYSVMLAKDGSDAVEKYVEHQANIIGVVSDMTMPRMGGRQMLKEILGINPKAVLILASGYTDDGTHDSLVALGAAEFIQKPYTIQLLAKTLHDHLPK